MEVIMAERFQCCFCGTTIAPRVPDVGSLLYTTCMDRSEQDQQSQQVYCHASCLRRLLHSSVQLYVLDLVEEEVPVEGSLAD